LKKLKWLRDYYKLSDTPRSAVHYLLHLPKLTLIWEN